MGTPTASIMKPKPGNRYRREDVVRACSNYVHSPAFTGNATEKDQKISLIQAKTSETLEFRPRGTRFGNSALNPNCWIPVSRDEDSQEALLPQPEFSAPMATSPQYNRRPWGTAYRNNVMGIWGGACAITGCREPALLTASHAKPPIFCTPKEKVDPYNGILLSKTYDALFDGGLISFDDHGTIIINETVSRAALESVGVDFNVSIRVEARHLPYLRFHRDRIFAEAGRRRAQRLRGR